MGQVTACCSAQTKGSNQNVQGNDQFIKDDNSQSQIKQTNVKLDNSQQRVKQMKNPYEVQNYQLAEVKDPCFNNYQKYQQIMDTLSNGLEWSDPDFSVTNSHKLIFGDAQQSAHPDWTDIHFHRVSQVFKNQEINLFYGKIEPDDILQGLLGDCYFLSSLAALCEYPKLIERLFNNKTFNQAGVYSLNLYLNGVWQEVLVDDYIPTKDNQPCFTKAHGQELWVILLEKAWAKIHGSYHIIEGGLNSEALHDLTGAPVEIKQFDQIQDQEQLWRDLLYAEQNNYVMCASSQSSFDGKSEYNGIQSGHAYTLVGAFEIQHQGNTVKLVKLRNPWGKTEYSGKWSDNDSVWNNIPNNEKQRIGFTNQDDGSFFMEYEFFQQYYRACSICYVSLDYKNTSKLYTSSNKRGKYFRVKVSKPGCYYFCADQKPHRNYPESLQDSYGYNIYSPLIMNISKVLSNEKYEYLNGVQEKERNSYVKFDHLETGEYIVQVRYDWRFDENDLTSRAQEKSMKFGFGLYGVDNVEIQEIDKSEVHNFIEQMLFSHAVQNKKSLEWQGIQSANNFFQGYFYYGFWNNTPNKTLKITYKTSNRKLKKPYKTNSIVEIKPNTYNIVCMRIVYDQNNSFKPGLSLQMSLK